MRKSGFTFWMAQSNGSRAEWAGARRICGAEQGDDRDVQRCREMQRAGVTAQKQPGALHHGDKLPDGAAEFKGIAGACLHHGVSKLFFAHGSIDQRLDIVDCKRARDLAEALRRPLLGAPARARVHHGKARDSKARDLSPRPAFSRWIKRKLRRREPGLCRAQQRLKCLRSQSMVLLNDVLTAAGKFLGVKKARSWLARRNKTRDVPHPTETRKQGRFDSALKVEREVIVHLSDALHCAQHFCRRRWAIKMLAPAPRVERMNMVDQRLARARGAGAGFSSLRSQQL